MWNLLRRGAAHPAPQLPRLQMERPDVVYAIGDVHGCLDELKRLEQRIVTDAQSRTGTKLIVMLGDYIDRGPKSAQTLAWLLRPAPTGFSRICLRGNHEAMFLDALARPDHSDNWFNWGGKETLESYGANPASFEHARGKTRSQILQSVVPEQHWSFLANLPVMLDLSGLLFVHAGIRPGVQLDQQTDEDLTWIREPFLSEPHGLQTLVVHGHTPSLEPAIHPHRIGIDTRAYASGVLTSLRISADGDIALITS